MGALNPDIYPGFRRHRQLLEQVRDAVEHNAPSIEFLEYVGHFGPAEQTLSEGWIHEVAVFVGRKLSFYVHVFTDRHLTLFVRDLDPGIDKPRKMVRHTRDPEKITWIILLLETNGVETVRRGDNNPPVFLKDKLGTTVLAY